jgi:hypothetical protein
VISFIMSKNPSQLTTSELLKAGNEAAKQAVSKLKAKGIAPVGHEVPLVGSKQDIRDQAAAGHFARKVS